MSSVPERTDVPARSEGSAARKQSLLALALLMEKMAGRLRTQDDAARQLGVMAAEAERIGFKAWEIACSKVTSRTPGAALAEELQQFADAMALCANKVMQEALVSRAVADVVSAQAASLTAAVDDPDALADRTAMRARLQNLVGGVSNATARLRVGGEMADAIGRLASDAADLAGRGRKLAERGHVGADSVAIYRELSKFAETTVSVSTRLAAESALDAGAAATATIAASPFGDVPLADRLASAKAQVEGLSRPSKTMVW